MSIQSEGIHNKGIISNSILFNCDCNSFIRRLSGTHMAAIAFNRKYAMVMVMSKIGDLDGISKVNKATAMPWFYRG